MKTILSVLLAGAALWLAAMIVLCVRDMWRLWRLADQEKTETLKRAGLTRNTTTGQWLP